MLTEIKGSLISFLKGKPSIQEFSSQTRLIALQAQEKDNPHPSDTLVESQIYDCFSCPGREQEIRRLLEIRARIEEEVAGSWDKSDLHRIDGKIALCSSCGQQEEPRILVKSA